MGLEGGALPHLPPEQPWNPQPLQSSPTKDRAIVTSLAPSKESTQSTGGARGRLGPC